MPKIESVWACPSCSSTHYPIDPPNYGPPFVKGDYCSCGELDGVQDSKVIEFVPRDKDAERVVREAILDYRGRQPQIGGEAVSRLMKARGMRYDGSSRFKRSKK